MNLIPSLNQGIRLSFILLSLLCLLACSSGGRGGTGAGVASTSSAAEDLVESLTKGSSYQAEDFHTAWRDQQVSYNPEPLVRGREERPHQSANPDEYHFEAWYFDALLNGTFTVRILFTMKDLLEEVPVARLAITGPDLQDSEEQITETAEVFFTKDQFYCAADQFSIAYGDTDGAYYDNANYRAFIDYGADAADLTFTPMVPGWKPGNTKIFAHKNEELFWQVPVPRATVTGQIRFQGYEYPVQGVGYMDHMWGNVHPLKVFRGRYWGRVYGENFTLVWMDQQGRIDGGGTEHFKALMAAKDDQLILSTEGFTLTPLSFAFDQDLNRDYPQAFTVDHDTLPMTLHTEVSVPTIQEKFDPVTESGLGDVVMQALRQVFSTPAQFRTRGEATGEIRRGETVEEFSGTAFSDSLFLY